MLATANGEKSREVLEKNAGEWTGRVEISKEEIPGSERVHVWLYTDLLQVLKGNV